jgi:hyperosmotically inducible periplasmic protein
MKIFLALIAGILIGGAAIWYYNTTQGKANITAAGETIGGAAKSATETVQKKLHALNLRPEDIKADLAKTGKVIRRTAEDAGQAIADGTADARVTAKIKAKLFASKDLSAMSITVNTTAGVVTLAGTVPTTDAISKAMLLAMETEGVREVISTLQVKPKN